MIKDKVTIAVGNVYSMLSDYTEELEKKLTCAYENYWFSPKYKSGLWDGMYHFLKIPSLKFPTGLMFLVTEYLKENGIEYEFIDNRKVVNPSAFILSDDMLEGITLRDYQKDAVREAVVNSRGILELPTGSGKTEIAIAVTKALRLKTLFLVNTKDLLHQTRERFKKRLGCDVGIVGDSLIIGDDENITIATVQTVNSLMKSNLKETKKWLNKFEVIFFDECHHASSQTFYKVGMFCHGAYYRFGLSGTALRRDRLSNLKLMALTGEQIYKLPAQELIDKGDISDIEIKIFNYPGLEYYGEKWLEIYDKGIVRNEQRNDVIANIACKDFAFGKRVMILVRYIEHGEILENKLQNEYKLPCVFIHGSHTSKERKEVKEMFDKDGDFILIASPIYNEGVDIPTVNSLIIGAGGKSEVRTIQQVGRGLRKKDDGSKLIVYDFQDTGKFLTKHSEKRIEIYKKEFNYKGDVK